MGWRHCHRGTDDRRPRRCRGPSHQKPWEGATVQPSAWVGRWHQSAARKAPRCCTEQQVRSYGAGRRSEDAGGHCRCAKRTRRQQPSQRHLHPPHPRCRSRHHCETSCRGPYRTKPAGCCAPTSSGDPRHCRMHPEAWHSVFGSPHGRRDCPRKGRPSC